MSGSLGSLFLPASLLRFDGLRGAEVRGQACPSRHHEALTTLEPCSTRLSTSSLGQPFYGRSPPPTGRSFRRSAVPTADPSLSRYSPQTPSHESEFPNPHAINKIVCPHHVTRSTPCYSGPVRAPAFRERQTGAPRPGCKSSPWPPSVSRSTDRVTQDNGIDPKPFWRLRAIPGAAPHQAAPGAPLAGRPGVGNCLSAPRTTVSGEKWGLPGLPPICSASCLRNKGLSLKRIGWLYPIFRQFPTLSMGENFEIPATDCHQPSP